MNIALAGDHTGFEQLKELQNYLESLGHTCRNFGPDSYNPDDDYPIFVKRACEAVARNEYDRAIILGGSGQGEAMVANRIKGIRCTVFYGPVVPLRTVDVNGRQSRDPFEIIKLSREHNDANVLSIADRFVTLADMKHIVKSWIALPFSNDPRHVRRVKQIDESDN